MRASFERRRISPKGLSLRGVPICLLPRRVAGASRSGSARSVQGGVGRPSRNRSGLSQGNRQANNQGQKQGGIESKVEDGSRPDPYGDRRQAHQDAEDSEGLDGGG